MDSFSDGWLLTALIILILASAFFSSSETGMVAINRYRLRHLARQGHRAASRVEALLKRTDRLLSVILIGNNFVNNFAATLSAILAIRWLGDSGAAVAPVVITLVMLVFAEITPKTYAAMRPERVAFPASFVLRPLQILLAPLVWLVNGISSGLLWLVGSRGGQNEEDHLSPEELRTVVNEAGGLIPEKHQKMLLNILDLESVSVEDIMIPRNEMVGIDIDDDMSEILNTLRASQHTRLPVYREDPNTMLGVLHLRKLSRLLLKEDINKAELMQYTVEPYFVPEGTSLNRQLINFQNAKRRIGIVVDEYGDVLGLVTLEDILEEIVGEFTTDLAATSQDIHPQEDGSYVIDGSTHLRDINRALGWEMPTVGPRTLNGLILEYLQDIPEANISIKVDDYLIEIMQVKDNMVKAVRVRRASANQRVEG
ncbi:HlyC/CorC family transporter [Alloalcanivorax mobilis]|uniref:HlyC/CorC family transporter n=1 Tax=Alloalcanivorax mobilis TaxID=2019569 RepID=UPI000C774011|nr:HlyC/CorC family transporter [Alloalcanivorax mobilis]